MVNQAVFRFYEELNDFLPKNRRKVEFVRKFEGNPSVKDVIESLGVPHVEVDLILVNSNPVGFGYNLNNDDRVSVYPVFESMDISDVSLLRGKPVREIKFVLDVHLGKLARYLRMLGFDTLYENNNDDWEIIRISKAENRIILTRDIGLLKVKAVTHGYYVRSQNPKEQLKEVMRRFDLHKSVDPFNRCIKCNGNLVRVEKESIIDRLEPLTKKYFNKFYMCTDCDSIFWEGSHYTKMMVFINNIKESAV